MQKNDHFGHFQSFELSHAGGPSMQQSEQVLLKLFNTKAFSNCFLLIFISIGIILCLYMGQRSSSNSSSPNSGPKKISSEKDSGWVSLLNSFSEQFKAAHGDGSCHAIDKINNSLIALTFCGYKIYPLLLSMNPSCHRTRTAAT